MMAIKDRPSEPTVYFVEEDVFHDIFDSGTSEEKVEYSTDSFDPTIFNMIHSIKSMKEIKDARFGNTRNN